MKRVTDHLHERLARGQLDALMRVLDALVREPDPDRFLEHVMVTIVGELRAYSIQAWLALAGGDDFECVADYQRDRATSSGARARGRLSRGEHASWGRLFRGQHGFRIGILETAPPRVRVAGTDLDASEPELVQTLACLHADGIVAVLCIPMQNAGNMIGCLNVHFTSQRSFAADELELAVALSHQAALAMQLTRLARESRQAAVVAERNRLARDIHDTLAQGLMGVLVQLEAADDAATRKLNQEVHAHLVRARDLARASLDEARRSVSALRPRALEAQSLGDALTKLAAQMTAGTPVRAEVSVKGTPPRLPPAYEEHLLRIGQEALTNTLRHANAKHIAISLTFVPNGARLRVRDDGRGFDPVRAHAGLGLRGIRERVQSMKGRLSVRSTSKAGTTISVSVSLHEAPEANPAIHQDPRAARRRSLRRARRPDRDR